MHGMIWDLKTASSSILLCVVIIHGTHGTIFPPVENPPPIPPPTVNRFFEQNSFKIEEDLPNSRDERFSQRETKTDEEGWYPQERQFNENNDNDSSFGELSYEGGEIGRVATPRPDISDETYQPSAIYGLDPRDFRNARNPEIFILTTNSDGQYNTGRLVQIPDGRLIEGQNPVAADTVKSFDVPVPFKSPQENSLPKNLGTNIVPIRIPNVPQIVYSNSPQLVENIPAVKQTGIPPFPPSNVGRIIQKRIASSISPVSFTQPALDRVSIKQSFTVPPLPPPPLKGADDPPKITSSIPVNNQPDSDLLISNKNAIIDYNVVPGKNIVQQIRHVWIPTSDNTGKFITIPISGFLKSEKPVLNKGFSLESTPITVSDTWVLKQDGKVSVFERQKSPLPLDASPIVQSGKVLFQNPTVVQLDAPKNPVVTEIDSPKNAPLIEKTVISNKARNIWPIRKELNAKILNSYSPFIASDIPVADEKPDTLVAEKPIAEYLTSPQKSIVTDRKYVLPPQISSSNVRIVNGKSCPFPLPASQKASFSPLNPSSISIPRILSAQRNLPFARIIKINRYPAGSYYLINRNIRPSYFIYPSQPAIQQPKTGMISIVPTKQIPSYIQRNIPIPPVQTKQISIAVQSKQFAPPVSAKQAVYPFISRQIVLPAPYSKSTRLNFPTAQAVRYAYPWNAYLKSSSVINKGAYIPEFSSFKLASESESSSSESSSSEESSDSSKEKTKAKPKKEEDEKEEKAKSGENSNPKEILKEYELNSKSKEIESEEKNSEKEPEDSPDISESDI